MDSRLKPLSGRQRVRPIRRVGEVAYVPLTQGYEAIIDAADIEKVTGRNWYAIRERRSGRVSAATSDVADGKKQTIYMHRVILPAGDLMVDHASGDALDNRRANLRAATPSQNTANCHSPIKNKSGMKGVWYDAKRGVFAVHIGVRGKRKHLGRYKSAGEAANAYDFAAIKFFGEFAKVNQALSHGQ